MWYVVMWYLCAAWQVDIQTGRRIDDAVIDVYNVGCTAYSVQCTVCSVPCTVYRVPCAVYGMEEHVLRSTKATKQCGVIMAWRNATHRKVFRYEAALEGLLSALHQ